MPRLLLALLLLSACDRCDAPVPLVAVVEDADSLLLKASSREGWRTLRALPSQARSVQVSPDGRSVAWIEDVTTDGKTQMQAWSWPASADAPAHLGESGLRKVDAPGLAIDDSGQTLWVDGGGVLQVWPDARSLGRGWSPRTASGAWAWMDAAGGCTRTRGFTVAEPLCDPVALLLDVSAGRLVVGTTARVEMHDADSKRTWSLDEPQAAALSAEGQVAVVHRARHDGAPVDALAVASPEGLKPVMQRALIVSVDWEAEDSLLVVASETRADIYELMLAHAPAEFGGGAGAGTAARVKLDGSATLIEGLPMNDVRLVRRVR